MIVAGFGFRSGATVDSLHDALTRAVAVWTGGEPAAGPAAGISALHCAATQIQTPTLQSAHPCPDLLATAAAKADSPAIQTLARRLSRPLRAIPAGVLAAQPTATQSLAALAAHGTGSVAESAALSAAGAGATLLTPRVISTDRMATCALARGGPAPAASHPTNPKGTA